MLQPSVHPPPLADPQPGAPSACKENTRRKGGGITPMHRKKSDDNGQIVRRALAFLVFFG